MDSFFVIFYEIENKFIDFGNNEFHTVSFGKMERKFRVGFDRRIDDEVMGKSISAYIDNLDRMIKYYFQYFGDYENRDIIRMNLEKMYGAYLKDAEIIL